MITATTDDHRIELKGLREDNPRDFLAVLGSFRLIDILWRDSCPMLSWDSDTSRAAIHTVLPLPADWTNQLVGALQQLNRLDSSPLRHGKEGIIKTDRDSFRSAVENAMQFGSTTQPLSSLPALLYSAYSSQLSEEKSDDIEPTWFSFGNGQSGKKLLLDVSQLIELLTPTDLSAALEGTATPIAAKSLRWHPAEFRPAAYRSHDPGSKLRGDETLDFPAFNVLAFIGLSFYPTVPTSSGGKTLGFLREKSRRFFVWPIWSPRLNSDELSTLLHIAWEDMNLTRGVLRSWKSRRFSAEKSLYFSPAKLHR